MSLYADGWVRVFGKFPKLRQDEVKFLKDYANTGNYGEIIIYLEKYRNIKGEDAEFILRELIMGNYG